MRTDKQSRRAGSLGALLGVALCASCSMPGGSDFRIRATGGDVEARFVRLVKLVAP